MKVTASQTRELKKVLKSIPDNRKPNGLRHSQESVLWPLLFVPSSVVVAVLLLLVSGPVALHPKYAETFGLLFSREKTVLYRAPSEPTIRRVLQSVDIETMKPAINNWVSSFFLNEVACEVGVTDFDKVVAYAVFLVPLSLSA